MSERMKASTAIGTPALSNYVNAIGVKSGQHADTSSTPQQLRTVATSMTTGQVSLRYAPRKPKPGSTETIS